MKEKIIQILKQYDIPTHLHGTIAFVIDKLNEEEIDKLKEIIKILSDFAQYGPFAFSEEEIMMRLEKVEQLKKGAGL